MSGGPKISVCVPAFERPQMICQLIDSFRRQDAVACELCIADDSITDEVERAVFNVRGTARLVYERQSPSLGFAGNLWRAMKMATGEVLVLLGDDDLLVDVSALSSYSDSFARNPSAHFSCSNLLQIDEDLLVTLAYPRTRCFELLVPAGEQALRRAWLSSIAITGLAFRRSDLLERYYPHEQFAPGVDRLYPQVELVGRLCLEHDALLLGQYLCGFRAHSRQLGFEAAKGAVGAGRQSVHGLVELPAIADRLAARYSNVGTSIADFCAAELARQYRTNMLNECLQVGARATRRRVVSYVRSQRGRPGSLTLLLTVMVATLLPRSVLATLKRAARAVVARRRLARAKIDGAFVRRFLDGAPPQ